ncbi:MAG: hypothetical protein NDI60_07165 [Elusimicrobiales bacterium]|nr:hypothetical protein [Elusimicrobiales bacterium]
MNFFRLRVINTLLFFVTGALIGFILKERFFPHKAQDLQPRYQPEYAASQTEEELQREEEPVLEAEEPPAAEQEKPRPARTQKNPEPEAETEKPAPILIETSVVKEEAPAEQENDLSVIKGSQDDFFSGPADYLGKDLEMELQMITARRTQRGWRLNFVYSGPDKKVDYLYVDDTDILPEKPDLRIGYVYRLRFHCSKGETASGNTLTLLTPTGGKAAWATGLSAVE